jgi:DNA-binding HxlR family transcriptional regulator
MQCPVGRTLERVGDPWTLLILRDAFQGLTRFDQFEKSLGVAPNILTKRLAGLVENGLIEKRRYSERPPRYEYVLTSMGRDFLPVLDACWRSATATSFPTGGQPPGRRRDRRWRPIRSWSTRSAASRSIPSTSSWRPDRRPMPTPPSGWRSWRSSGQNSVITEGIGR